MTTPTAVVRSPEAFLEGGDVSGERPRGTTWPVLVLFVRALGLAIGISLALVTLVSAAWAYTR
jgi:hypothetical protein